MDSSSTSSASHFPNSEYKAGARQAKLGFRLIVAGIVAMIAMFVLGFFFFFRDLTGMERVRPGQSESIELDQGTYLIYDESFPAAEVVIIGESGSIELGGVTASSSVTINDFRARATHSVDIDTDGTYVVQNNGTGRIAIGKPIVARIFALVFGPFIIGFLIIGIGIFMVIKGQGKRRRNSGWDPGNVYGHRTVIRTRRATGPDSSTRETTTVTETFSDGETTSRTSHQETEYDDGPPHQPAEPQDDLNPQSDVGNDGPQDDLSDHAE